MAVLVAMQSVLILLSTILNSAVSVLVDLHAMLSVFCVALTGSGGDCGRLPRQLRARQESAAASCTREMGCYSGWPNL